MLITLLSLLNMYSSGATQTHVDTVAPIEDDGGSGNAAEERRKRIMQEDEDILIIISQWITNRN